ncbi:hypothetical protein DBY21_06360 [Candidatus Gastranaerophilales bacterium]|nr:MAG: hypothetical protein DBY21_06360 [Candidatus Gastranaerophilales bacterium]
MKKLKFVGFTMAEVLITLSIVGIIAAMTIPQLIKNYQAKILEVGLKKSYANLSNAYLMTKASLGVSNLRKAFATYDSDNVYVDAPIFIDEFYKHLNVVKKLDSIYPMTNFNKTKIITSDPGRDSPKAFYILPDGGSIGVDINNSSIIFWVDTNGPYAKPNRIGFDIFEFRVNDASDQIKPLKQTRSYTQEELEDAKWPEVAGYPCNKTSTQLLNGIGCTWFAVNDVSPEDQSKHYWKNLPW